MNKIKRQFIINRVNKQIEKIAKARDTLRQIEEEVGEYISDADEGIEDLRAAVDALSKHL